MVRSPTRRGIVAVRDYLSFVDDAAGRRYAAPASTRGRRRAQIAVEIRARPDFGALGEFGRIAVNVDTVYRHLDPATPRPNVVEQFRRMAELEHATPGSHP